MSFKILFFDSGVGGLSVYNEVMKVCSSKITSLYLFDNYCCPYGSKEENFVKSRVTSLLVKACESMKLDMIVIACNTASTIALDVVRKKVSIPVVGVVPAIKPAAKITTNKVIGLLATPGTIARNYTSELINKYAKEVKVLKIGTTKLVNIAEKKIAGESFDIEDIKQVLEPWMSLSNKPDTVVLGCTHFPLIQQEISELLPNCKLVDSGEAIARRVNFLLSNMNDEITCYEKPKAYCTDTSRLSENLKISLSRFGFESINLFTV
jgi:glutamate racemase